MTVLIFMSSMFQILHLRFCACGFVVRLCLGCALCFLVFVVSWLCTVPVKSSGGYLNWWRPHAKNDSPFSRAEHDSQRPQSEEALFSGAKFLNRTVMSGKDLPSGRRARTSPGPGRPRSGAGGARTGGRRGGDARRRRCLPRRGGFRDR